MKIIKDIGSTMPRRYRHLKGDEARNQILKYKGIIKDDKVQNNVLAPKACPLTNCRTSNAFDALKCSTCGYIFSFEERKRIKEQERIEKQKREEIEILREQIESSDKRSREMIEQIKILHEQIKMIEPIKKAERQKMKLEYEEAREKIRQKVDALKANCNQTGEDLQTSIEEEMKNGSFFADMKEMERLFESTGNSAIRWKITKDDIYEKATMSMNEIIEREFGKVLPPGWRNFKRYEWDRYAPQVHKKLVEIDHSLEE